MEQEGERMNRLNDMSRHLINVWFPRKEYVDTEKDVHYLLGHEARAIAIAVRCSHRPVGIDKMWWNGNRRVNE